MQIYETASSETIPASQRRLNLLEMCLEQLKKHLKMVGSDKLTYEAMKAEIAECVADKVRRPTRQRAVALEQSGPCQDATGGACGDSEWDRAYAAMDVNQLMAMFLETPDEGMNPHQLNALVKRFTAKNGKPITAAAIVSSPLSPLLGISGIAVVGCRIHRFTISS